MRKRNRFNGKALVAAICLVGAAGGAMPAAAELGRLFTAPAQRAELDKVRFAAEVKEEKPAEPEREEVVKAPAPPPVKAFRMAGLVLRNQGPNTAWIDGRPVLREGRTAQGVAVDPRRASASGLVVTIPGEEQGVALKPGQSFDPDSDRIIELAPATSGGAADGPQQADKKAPDAGPGR